VIENISVNDTPFQFLIGTVKTGYKKRSISKREKFQFLIGTVKTQFPHSQDDNFLFVSIPHRYCKNEGILKFINRILVVSIPHRYCKNWHR